MKDIQQLIKKNSQDGRYESIFPKTFTDAVIDRENGAKLTDILAMFNMLFLSYVGSKSLTRLEVPISLRKTGIWITYVLYDKTVVTEWYAGEAIDDTSFSNDSNWRDGTNSLVGDISISSDGYWVINGEVTTIEAQGEAGITPILRVGSNNHLQVSYTNGSSYIDVSPNPVYTQFRVLNNKLQQSTDLGNTYTYISEELAYKFQESGNKLQMSKDLGDTWEDVSDYIAAWFRFTGTTGSSQADNVGKIQISRDKGNTWTDLSGVFTNSLHIKGYVATVDALPSTAVQGDIYGVGPIYDPSDTEQTNPIYQLYIKDSTGWVNNGRFTSIAAGVVQTTGTSTTEVMSQNAVTTELDSLRSDLGQLDEKLIIDDASSDLSFADSNYNEIVQFKNGGIKTKNFDSTKILSASKETGADVDICDEDDNIVLRVSKGHIKTKYFDSTVVNSEPSSIMEIVEDTFQGGRFKYDEVGVLDYYAAYDELCDYRHIVEKETPIGYSTLPSGDRLSRDAKQYPINLYRIPNANATKRIVLMGSIHGDSQYTEANPTGNGWYGDAGDAQEAILTPYFFVVDLIRHRDDNPQYKKLLETYEIDIIPIINPWGVQNHSRRNGNNVDLNRNFDVTDSNGESRWENVQGSSGAGKGASAFSENESQAIRDYINSHNDIHLVIETHARGNVNLEGDYRFFVVYPDDDSARELESAINNAVISARTHFGSGGGSAGYTRDNTNPSCYAWIFYEKGIPAFEPELAQNMANRFYSIITLSEDRRLNVNDVYTDSSPQIAGYAHTIRVVSSDGSSEALVETETYFNINNGVFTCGNDSITISSHRVLDSKARHSKELQYSQVWYYKRLLFNTL